MTKINSAHAILGRAIMAHKPSIVVACFSGGYDSMVATHVALRWSKTYLHSANILVVAVDTLVSADGWREFVTDAAHALGTRRFEIWNNPELDSWQNDVRSHGFAYRRHQHHIYFYYLKQRVFRSVLQAHKKHRHDRVVFVNGIRRAESAERAGAPEVERRGSGVFVNPLLYWTDEDVEQYRTANTLPINPFYDAFGNSGDCLCNWHTRVTLGALKEHAPRLAERVIVPLDEEARALYGYGYGEEPADWRKQEAAGQLRLFDWDTECTPNLCAGCSRAQPTNEERAYWLLQNMEW